MMHISNRQLLSVLSPAGRLASAAFLTVLALSTSGIHAASADESGVAQPLVVLRQTGGFAGIDETTTIWDDGRIERLRSRPPGDQTLMRLAGGADDASALRTSIEATGLPNLPAGGSGPAPCCDRITTTLTLTFTVPPQEFQTYDAGNAPAPLTDSMRIVYDAVQSALVLDADADGSEDDLEQVPDDVRR